MEPVDPTIRKRLLFVCVENSNRSQMAEAFARMLGGDLVEAHSVGSKPSGRVNPRALESMKEVGYDLSTHRSKSISDISPGEFDAVVSMGCGETCPFVSTRRREDWQIPDPKKMEPEQFRAIRDKIRSQVQGLLDELLGSAT